MSISSDFYQYYMKLIMGNRNILIESELDRLKLLYPEIKMHYVFENTEKQYHCWFLNKEGSLLIKIENEKVIYRIYIPRNSLSYRNTFVLPYSTIQSNLELIYLIFRPSDYDKLD